jgi:hypothetical protein
LIEIWQLQTLFCPHSIQKEPRERLSAAELLVSVISALPMVAWQWSNHVGSKSRKLTLIL